MKENLALRMRLLQPEAAHVWRSFSRFYNVHACTALVRLSGTWKAIRRTRALPVTEFGSQRGRCVMARASEREHERVSRTLSLSLICLQVHATSSQQSFAGSDGQESSVAASSSSLALRRRHVGKNKGSWGQDEYESAEMASFHELAAVIGPEEAASDRLAAQRRAQGAGAIIKQALRLGRDNPVRKATTRVRLRRGAHRTQDFHTGHSSLPCVPATVLP